MSRILTISSLLCLALLLAAPVQATTYYVATNGDDEDPGTESEPWATLQYAVDSVSAGDTIIVKAGTYTGCRIENLSATSSNPCTLKAQTAGSVLLNVPHPTRAKHNGILEIENYSGTVDYWTVDGFEVDGDSETYRCIDVRITDHITVKNCEVYDAYMTGIQSSFSDYMLVENCISYSNGEHGIYMANSADNGVVRGNTSYSNTGCGIHMNGDESMGGDGQMSYWLVEKNICYQNPSGSAINCDGVSNSKIYNNLLYNNTGSGVSLYAIDGAAGSSNDLVYNNTIVMPSDGRWCVNIPEASGSKDDPTYNKVKNNILMNAHTFRGAITTYSSSVTGFESDYNAVVDRFSIDGGDTNISLSTWQGYGYDGNSFLSTPSALFTNPGSNDYTLKDGSPAINAGTTLSDVSDDIEGTSRPQGSAYDIGCYEAGGEIQDLEITTTSLPNGVVNTAYSETVQATGGVTPYTWSVISGSLPSGLSLASSTGVISGTPTTEETANFTVQVTDSQDPADTDTQALSITIDPGAEPLEITTTSLPDGTKKQSYSQTLAATGGVTPYTWSIVSGGLPNGLSLNSSTGEISGTCRKTGTWNFTVRCTDSQDPADTDDQALSITVNN